MSDGVVVYIVGQRMKEYSESDSKSPKALTTRYAYDANHSLNSGSMGFVAGVGEGSRLLSSGRSSGGGALLSGPFSSSHLSISSRRFAKGLLPNSRIMSSLQQTVS